MAVGVYVHMLCSFSGCCGAWRRLSASAMVKHPTVVDVRYILIQTAACPLDLQQHDELSHASRDRELLVSTCKSSLLCAVSMQIVGWTQYWTERICKGGFCLQGKLMTSWAVVCDVYFLEPQKKGEDESAQQFAERVQRLIAERAKLQIAPWDGYLKYYTLGVKVRPSRLPACPGASAAPNQE